MKIALVHDYIGEFGGAERVLAALSDMWPDAPIYTAFYRPGEAWERFKNRNVRVSWVHHIPFFASKLHSPLRFLAPMIWNSFDFSSYDVVISSASWYVTKGFVKKGSAKEICYCHTPPRWLYGYSTSKQNLVARLYGTLVGFFMRQYDYNAAQRVDYFIANSEETKRRICKFYRRDATVIYPPIIVNDVPLPVNKRGRTYYLIVSRLAQPKNIELAIRAANTYGLPLKILGTGPDEKRLRVLAGPTVEFLGFASDENVQRLYRGAKAFLAMSSDEDFGMTPVEAMEAGTPVIAFRGGGYVETVIEGKTGVFFDELTVASLISAIHRCQKIHFLSRECQSHARKFSLLRFQDEIRRFVSFHVRHVL